MYTQSLVLDYWQRLHLLNPLYGNTDYATRLTEQWLSCAQQDTRSSHPVGRKSGPSTGSLHMDIYNIGLWFYTHSRARELCESQSRWPSWTPVPNKSVDVKQDSTNLHVTRDDWRCQLMSVPVFISCQHNVTLKCLLYVIFTHHRFQYRETFIERVFQFQLIIITTTIIMPVYNALINVLSAYNIHTYIYIHTRIICFVACVFCCCLFVQLFLVLFHFVCVVGGWGRGIRTSWIYIYTSYTIM